jgi:mannose-6-phosphate isomerase-like protein (cupin superfamily)
MSAVENITLNTINETIFFSKTSDQTNGAYLELIVTLPFINTGPLLHLHPFQAKYFRCIEGELIVDLVKNKVKLKPGESYTVPLNIAHTCYPSSTSGAKFKIIYTPALNFEYIVKELFASSNRRGAGHASIFDVAYVFTQCRGEFFAANYPILLQKIAFPILAMLGKLMGKINAKKREESCKHIS